MTNGIIYFAVAIETVLIVKSYDKLTRRSLLWKDPIQK